MKSWFLVNRPTSIMGIVAVLLYENGQYVVKYVNNATLDIFKVKDSMKGTLLKPGMNSTVDLNGVSSNSVTSGTKMTASLKGSAASGSIDEVELSLGGSMADVGMEVTFWENDLSKYVGKVDVSIRSAKIKSNLASDGISIKTPGLIGIGISGGKVDLIDLDTNL